MTIFKSQTVDLGISHNQIVLCDHTVYDDSRFNWGELNVEQGALLHPDCLTFDPLPEGAFGAFVYLSTADNFELDKMAQRAMVAPLVINNPDNLEVGSVPMQFKIELDLKPGSYHVYFEICEDLEDTEKEEDRISYKFTLIKQSKNIRPHYLLDDPWGGEKGKELVIGKADKPFTMKLARMQKYLYSLGIPKTYQVFTAIPAQEREAIKRSIGWHGGGYHCISHDFELGEGWAVFYAERGSRFGMQTFANEADACYELIYRECGK